MEGIRTFLESSTIHGLTYISTTRKFARIFWIIIVIAGFSSAFYLINSSFNSWDESPIKTTIETMAISDITLPKVTVCPPKNTFTDLNYDLMMAENLNLTTEIQKELKEYSSHALNIAYTERIRRVHEKNGYFNWYHGLTRISLPIYRHESLQYTIDTIATSGAISTQYYGEKFQPENVEMHLELTLTIFLPKMLNKTDNITLHIEMEWIYSDRYFRNMKISTAPNRWNIDERAKKLSLNITTESLNKIATDSPYFLISYSHEYYYPHKLNLDTMPGFKIRWHYSGGDVAPETNNKLINTEDKSSFIRKGFLNIFSSSKVP